MQVDNSNLANGFGDGQPKRAGSVYDGFGEYVPGIPNSEYEEGHDQQAAGGYLDVSPDDEDEEEGEDQLDGSGNLEGNWSIARHMGSVYGVGKGGDGDGGGAGSTAVDI